MLDRLPAAAPNQPLDDPATRAEACAGELAAVTVKVGYPDRWETYEAVALADSFAGSLRSALAARLAEHFAKAGNRSIARSGSKPSRTSTRSTSRRKTRCSSRPASCDPPFFDYEADAASNLGGIGFHRSASPITHGSTPGGQQFEWRRVICGIGGRPQTGSALWRWQRRARRTILGDRGGAGALRERAVHRHRELSDLAASDPVRRPPRQPGKDEAAWPCRPPGSTPAAVTVAPPFTPQQRFFIAAAASWRIRDPPGGVGALRPHRHHAPDVVRGTQPLRNADPFFTAFGIEPGDPMWLAPEERIVYLVAPSPICHQAATSPDTRG